MSRGLILFWLIAPLNPLWAQTPCSGIDRNLGLSSGADCENEGKH